MLIFSIVFSFSMTHNVASKPSYAILIFLKLEKSFFKFLFNCKRDLLNILNFHIYSIFIITFQFYAPVSLFIKKTNKLTAF